MTQPLVLKLISREFDGFARSFGLQAEHYERLNPHIVIQREFSEIHRLYDRMIAGREALGADYDLMLCTTDWIPEAIRDELLTPLNEFLDADPPEGWPDAWSPSMRGLQTAADGKVYGIAYHDGPEIMLYRSDLFENEDERKRFLAQYGYELQPPETWSQFLDVARFFTRPDDELHGALIAGFPDGHNNVFDFLIQLWSRGGQLVSDKWEPAFHGAEGEEALQYYVDLVHRHRVAPLEALELDSVRCGDYFAQGKAAMMLNWCGFAAVAEMPASLVAGKVKTAFIPKGDGPGGKHVSLNIYWVLTLPAGSRNKQEAYRFIKETASAAMDKITSLAGGNGTRLSTWRDEEVRVKFPYYRHIEQVHNHVNHTLPIPEYPAINDVLSRMVDDCLNQRKSARQALDEAAGQTAQILRQAGYGA